MTPQGLLALRLIFGDACSSTPRGQAAGRLFLRFPFRSCRLRLSLSRRPRSDGSRVDAAQLAEVPERPGLVGLSERPRIWRSGNNCHSGGELDGGVGGTYHLVARMPSA
jgi:hypothetical protein